MKKKQWIAAGSLLAIMTIVFIGFFIFKGHRGTVSGETAIDHSTHQGQDAGTPPAAAEPADEGETDEEESPTIEISRDMQKMIGVKTVAAKVMPMSKTIRLTGRIEYNEQKLFTVTTKVEGWIEKLYVDYAGRHLKKGEPILEIYSPELQTAQQELINISAWKNPGEQTATNQLISGDLDRLKDAARKRLRLWDISEEQIRKIEKTGKPMRTLTITSPVSGYVAQRNATRGMRVMAGEPLLEIADLSQVWVIAEASEADASLIRKGQPVSITITGLPGKAYRSSIDYVYSSMNAETRTLRARATLDNRDDILKPGMFSTVEIRVDLGNRLAVPEESVMDTGERQVVYVDKGEGLFEPRTVIAGLRAGGMREIISSLKSGELVAASALFLLDSEAQLKGVAPAQPVPSGTAPSAPAHQH